MLCLGAPKLADPALRLPEFLACVLRAGRSSVSSYLCGGCRLPCFSDAWLLRATCLGLLLSRLDLWRA
eukprot:5896865-Heterocapsa_arctica.AAC.1